MLKNGFDWRLCSLLYAIFVTADALLRPDCTGLLYNFKIVFLYLHIQLKNNSACAYVRAPHFGAKMGLIGVF